MSLDFGISLHTVTTDLTPRGLSIFASSPVKSFEIKQTLFDGPASEERKAALRNFMVETGIVAATIHASFGDPYDWSSLRPEIRARGLETVRAAIDLAVYFDAPMVVVHASAEPIDEAERPERLLQAKRSLQQIEPWARSAGRKIAVEVLPRTCLGRTVDELLRIIEPFDPAVIGACLDTNHFMRNYAAVPAAVGRLGERLLTLHLSDYDGIDEQHWLPGRGVLDWPGFMSALREAGYAGPFIYECSFRPREKLNMICENYAWLSRL